ncbi:hypothetical protein LCGC14_2785330 [marine sediment metagenome]|uniref:Uncharacterized protein n=1 Tax=marine sediment metagenome TaxID=412755 RepID=A0A0F8YS35_9ZZZZ
MKPLIICLLTIFFSIHTCSEKSSNRQIEKFERILGEKSSGELTLLVNEFEENILKIKYPAKTIRQSYELLFKDIRKYSPHIFELQTDYGQTIWENSTLKNEIYRYPDSVWVEGDLIKTDYRTPKSDGTFESGIYTTIGLNLSKYKTVDSLISYHMNKPIMNVNGKFWQALRELEKDNKFVEKYNGQIKLIGHIPYYKIPDVVDFYEIDPTDFLIKRILIKSMIY